MSRTITDDGFEKDVLGAKGLSVVDLWAEWCAPCRALSPTLEALGEENRGSLNVFKLDVDANPLTPLKFEVRGIPTMLFFKDGVLVDRLVGNHAKKSIQETIEKHK